MNRKGCFLAGVALLLGELLLLVVFMFIVGRFLAVDEPVSEADAIVVLGGECGEFPRVEYGLELYNAGYASVVVFSGGTMQSAGLACSSGHLSMEAAQQLGLPANAAVIADGAQSTYDEAVNLRRLTKQHGWQTLIVVTSPFHTRRAGRTFRSLLPNATIYVSSAPDPDQDAGRWWQNEDDLVTVVNEVLKLAFYWAKYGIAPVG